LRHLPDAELWMVGDGNLRPELEEHTAALGLATHVRFYGQLSDEGRDERLRTARCLALPSKGEGFGLVYVEAMRLGRPCLVSDVDAGREVVEPPVAGLAVNPDDGDAIARALVRLLTPGDEWT